VYRVRNKKMPARKCVCVCVCVCVNSDKTSFFFFVTHCSTLHKHIRIHVYALCRRPIRIFLYDLSSRSKGLRSVRARARARLYYTCAPENKKILV
jgi:hypothetical protein